LGRAKVFRHLPVPLAAATASALAFTGMAFLPSRRAKIRGTLPLPTVTRTLVLPSSMATPTPVEGIAALPIWFCVPIATARACASDAFLAASL
jgi:hypothetical protein